MNDLAEALRLLHRVFMRARMENITNVVFQVPSLIDQDKLALEFARETDGMTSAIDIRTDQERKMDFKKPFTFYGIPCSIEVKDGT